MERAHVAAGGPFCVVRRRPKFLGRFYTVLSAAAPIFERFYTVLSLAAPIYGRFYAVLPVAASTGLFPCMPCRSI